MRASDELVFCAFEGKQWAWRFQAGKVYRHPLRNGWGWERSSITEAYSDLGIVLNRRKRAWNAKPVTE